MSIFSFLRDMLAIKGAKNLFNDVTKPHSRDQTSGFNYYADDNVSLHDYSSYDLGGSNDFDDDFDDF